MNAKEKVIVGLFMTLFSSGIYSQDITIEQVGHLAGWPGSFDVEGNYAYLATGPSLTVLDLSSTQIRQVASVTLPSEPVDVFTSGNIAYVAGGNLQIVDISNPEDASILTTYEISGVNVNVRHVYVSGDYAYVAADMGGLRILDISNPSSPVEVGSLAIDEAARVFVLNNRAYVVDSSWPCKLWVVNATSPESPAFMGSCQVGGFNGIFVLGNTAYVACGWNGGIQIVDISDPANPTVKSSYGAGSKNGYDVSAYSNYAYVAGSSGGLIILDVSDPENPTELNVLTEIKTSSIQLRYPSAYVVFGGDDGFRELDFSDPVSPNVTGQFEMASGALSLYASGNHLYLSSYERFWIYDLLADPEVPTPLDSYPEWKATNIFVQDGYAYLLSWDHVYILDVSDPAEVTQKSSLIGSGSGKIFVRENYAYVVLDGQMQIIDVSNPSSPVRSGGLSLSGSGDVFVPEGSDVAYVVDGGGLHTVNVSNPGAPGILASIGISKDAACVWVSDNMAFVGSNSGGVFCIEAFDVSDSSSLAWLGKTDDDSGKIGDIEVHDGMILAAVSGHSGVYVYTYLDGLFTTGPRCQGQAYQITSYNPVPDVWYEYTGAESYGGDIQKLTKGEPVGEAVLVLGMGGEEAKIFPPDSSEEINIAEASLTAQVDDWHVIDVVLTCEGNGKMSELKEAILRVGGREIEGEVVEDSEGLMDYITFGVNEDIGEGETLSMMLYYKLRFPSCTDTAFMPCPLGEVKTYGVSYTISQVNAIPKNLQSYKKLPPLPTRLYSPITTIGCVLVLESSDTSSKSIQKIVSNQQDVILVKDNIQEAVDDDKTKEHYTLRVFSGMYKENVNVTKQLTIESEKGSNRTIVSAETPNDHVFEVTKQKCIVGGFTIKGATGKDKAGIFLNGSFVRDCYIGTNNILGNHHGILIAGGAKKNRVIGSIISGNGEQGILIKGVGTDSIFVGDCKIGTENKIGVEISDGAKKNRIGDFDYVNIISGNSEQGVLIEGTGTDSNEVCFNFIGTDEEGKTELPNKVGVEISGGANSNIIGKQNSGNTISGNNGQGVLIKDTGTELNKVCWNYIGTDVEGKVKLPNKIGVEISGEAKKNKIGEDVDIGNIISGNKEQGVLIEGMGTDSNEVCSNIIGMDNECKTKLPNKVGVEISGGARKNEVSGGMISGNSEQGVLIKCTGTDSNKVYSNSIGHDNKIGIQISDGAKKNIIGGQNYGNTISDNILQGILIKGIGTDSNQVCGSRIGTDVDGKIELPNNIGIEISGGAKNNCIMEQCIISGNDEQGVLIKDTGTDMNKVVGATIGTDEPGKTKLPNKIGVEISGGAKKNEVVGGIISGNSEQGVLIKGNGTCENKLFLASIGTDGFNEIRQPNKIGVEISDGASRNTIGKQEFGNTISGNSEQGVLIKGKMTFLNNVYYNKIGTDEEGEKTLANKIGVEISDGATLNEIGKKNSGNIISGNNEQGVLIKGIGTDLNSVYDNKIGTNKSLIKDLGNKGDGICITNSSTYDNHTRIEWNYILYNEKNGIRIYLSNRNRILYNIIWENKLKGVEMGNSRNIGIQTNSIMYNKKNTGIHLDNSSGEIIGNTIEGDEGDAIMCENGSDPIIYRNNIFNNSGFGLNNLDPSVTINAQGNWWGDASGPGGAGSGSGEEVSGNVDFSDWRSEPVALVIFAGEDTVFVPSGSVDSVYCYFQNWQNLNDILNVDVFAEDMGWLVGPTTFAVTLEDSMGASASIQLSVPPGSPPGAENLITVTATSTSDPNTTDADSFLVMVYESLLMRISVWPDSVTVHTGDSVQFSASGYDQFDNMLEFNPIWDATDGTIDSSGLYVAGTETGTFSVTASDASGQIQGHAVVEIVPEAFVKEERRYNPTDFCLYQNYPNPFNPETTIRFDVKERTRVVLKVYDMMGREVLTLVDSEYDQGRHNITFDSSRVTSGLYFYWIQMGDFCDTKKMILLK